LEGCNGSNGSTPDSGNPTNTCSNVGIPTYHDNNINRIDPANIPPLIPCSIQERIGSTDVVVAINLHDPKNIKLNDPHNSDQTKRFRTALSLGNSNIVTYDMPATPQCSEFFVDGLVSDTLVTGKVASKANNGSLSFVRVSASDSFKEIGYPQISLDSPQKGEVLNIVAFQDTTTGDHRDTDLKRAVSKNPVVIPTEELGENAKTGEFSLLAGISPAYGDKDRVFNADTGGEGAPVFRADGSVFAITKGTVFDVTKKDITTKYPGLNDKNLPDGNYQVVVAQRLTRDIESTGENRLAKAPSC